VFCPYIAHRPLTLEGVEAWELLIAGQGQIRVAGMGGAIGLDLAAVLELGRLRGCDAVAMAELMPDCETGLVAGLNKKTDEGASG